MKIIYEIIRISFDKNHNISDPQNEEYFQQLQKEFLLKQEEIIKLKSQQDKSQQDKK